MRVLRRLMMNLAFLANVAVLLCFACLWCRGQAGCELFRLPPSWASHIRAQIEIGTWPGRVCMHVSTPDNTRPSPTYASGPWSVMHLIATINASGRDHRALFAVAPGPADGEWLVVCAPWCLVILCSLWPGLSLWISMRRRRHHRVSHCLHCSYDLRAHAPGDKCPECGRMVPPDVPRPSMDAKKP